MITPATWEHSADFEFDCEKCGTGKVRGRARASGATREEARIARATGVPCDHCGQTYTVEHEAEELEEEDQE